MAIFGGILGDILGAPGKALGLDLSGIPGLNLLFENPNEEKMQKAMSNAKKETEKQRIVSQKARMQALKQILPLFAPYNQALSSVYGPGYQIPTDQLAQDPLETARASMPQTGPTITAEKLRKMMGEHAYGIAGGPPIQNKAPASTAQAQPSAWSSMTPQQQLDLINKAARGQR